MGEIENLLRQSFNDHVAGIVVVPCLDVDKIRLIDVVRVVDGRFVDTVELCQSVVGWTRTLLR